MQKLCGRCMNSLKKVKVTSVETYFNTTMFEKYLDSLEMFIREETILPLASNEIRYCGLHKLDVYRIDTNALLANNLSSLIPMIKYFDVCDHKHAAAERLHNLNMRIKETKHKKELSELVLARKKALKRVQELNRALDKYN